MLMFLLITRALNQKGGQVIDSWNNWLIPSLKLDGCPRTTRWAHMTLILGLPEQMFQMANLVLMENNCVNLYWNPTKLYEL